MNAQSATPASPFHNLTAPEQRVLAMVLQAIRQIQYGYVQIIVQDGRVVQVDKLEKARLPGQ